MLSSEEQQSTKLPGFTKLMNLIHEKKELNVIEKYLENNREEIICTTDNRRSVLHFVISKLHFIPSNMNGYDIKVIKLLLSYGINIDLQDDRGKTALMMALDWPTYRSNIRGTDIIQLLLDHGANSNLKDSMGWSALMMAIGTSPEIIKLLLNHGADVNSKDIQGLTPLMLAVRYAASNPVNIEKIKILLDHGACVDLRNIYGCTPLMEGHYNFSAIKVLLDHGANANLKNDAGMTALALAARDLRNMKSISLLLQYDINVRITSVKELDYLSPKIIVENFDFFSAINVCQKQHAKVMPMMIPHGIKIINRPSSIRVKTLMLKCDVEYKKMSYIELRKNHEYIMNYYNIYDHDSILNKIKEALKDI